MILRAFHPDDAPTLLELFRTTIRRVNSRDYTPEQVQAWASEDIDPEAWASRFHGRFGTIAEIDGEVAGFAELDGEGHIDRFFVSANHQRLGVGRLLMDSLCAEARRMDLCAVDAEVSITARPFFETQGFVVLQSQDVVVRGVEFRNFRMSRQLS